MKLSKKIVLLIIFLVPLMLVSRKAKAEENSFIDPQRYNFLISLDKDSAVKIVSGSSLIADCPICGHNHAQRIKVFFEEYLDSGKSEPPKDKKYWIGIFLEHELKEKIRIVVSKISEEFCEDKSYTGSSAKFVDVDCSPSRGDKIRFSHLILDAIDNAKKELDALEVFDSKKPE